MVREKSKIGNDRLFLAVVALVKGAGDSRKRVCAAMRILDAVPASEFKDQPELSRRLDKLRQCTSSAGKLEVNGHFIRDRYENTAIHRWNKTYSKYAEEIFELWRQTLL